MILMVGSLATQPLGLDCPAELKTSRMTGHPTELVGTNSFADRRPQLDARFAPDILQPDGATE